MQLKSISDAAYDSYALATNRISSDADEYMRHINPTLCVLCFTLKYLYTLYRHSELSSLRKRLQRGEAEAEEETDAQRTEAKEKDCRRRRRRRPKD